MGGLEPPVLLEGDLYMAWYSYQRLLSQNCFMNIVMSPRGNGKSYGAKKIMIDNFLKKGKQSVYVRRTQTELDGMKMTFFADIAEAYPDVDFDVKGDIGYINGEEAVYMIALSTSLKKKSSAYPKVTSIFFDEYVISNGASTRYLREEVFMLFELIETVMRTRNTPDMRVVLMANAVSYVNPLFTFYNIEPDPNLRFQKFHNKQICLELFTDENFMENKKNTRFGQLIKGTSYADYAIGNVAYEDSSDYIMKKREGSRWEYLMTLKTEGRAVAVWADLYQNMFHIDDNVKLESTVHNYTMTSDDIEEGFVSIKTGRDGWRVKQLKRAHHQGNLYYMNQDLKKFFNTTIIRYI